MRATVAVRSDYLRKRCEKYTRRGRRGPSANPNPKWKWVLVTLVTFVPDTNVTNAALGPRHAAPARESLRAGAEEEGTKGGQRYSESALSASTMLSAWVFLSA